MQCVIPRLCLLGQPRLELDGKVVLLPLDRVLWLLAAIALPGDWVRRSVVANLIWDDSNAEAIAQRLRQLLYRAKHLGFGAGIELDAGRLRWAGTCDLLEWRAAVQIGDEQKAIELASGDLLAGVLVDSTEFGAWLELERQSFSRFHQQLVLRHAARLERDGQLVTAYGALERCAQIMLIEEGLLLEALRMAGLADQPKRGLGLFEAHKKELLTINQTPSRALKAAAQLLEQPRFVAPRSLPQVATPLFGRERELRAVFAWIASEARLLSLVGVGGIGKTSLALEGLRATNAVLVPLSGFTGGSLTSSVATALGAVLPGQSEADRELLAWLSRHPAQILLLDNVEQCVVATRAFVKLIASTPWRVVVTSRLKLALREEQILELEGLACPQHPDDLNQASVLLFVSVARRVSGGRFVLAPSDAPDLVRLCKLLAGTPLALELAGSWLRLLSVSEITEEVARNLDFLEGGLQNLPIQQSGLRAVFTHSHALLSPQQQLALARLAVFRGGFTRSAALEITEVSHRDLLALTDASLIKRGLSGDRWQIHELIRQYASEYLHANLPEWQTVAEAHGRYYLELARVTPAAQLHEEADNFRAVLTWSLSKHDAIPALELATQLRLYWTGRGLVQEGSTWLQAALDTYPRGDQLSVRARLVLAEFLQTQGHSAAAQAQIQTAERTAQTLQRTDLESSCQTMYARIAHRISRYESAIVHCHEALRLAGDDLLCQAAAYRWLGRAEIFKGDLNDATLHIETALRMHRRVADHEAVAHCLNSLALIAIERQDYAGSRTCFQEALALHRTHQEKHGQALNLSGMGWLEFTVGDFEAAQALTEQSLEMLNELGHQWEMHNAQLNLGHIAFKRHQPVEAKRHYREVLLQAALIEATSLQLEALVGMAYLYGDQPLLAAELLGTALTHPQVNHEVVSFAQRLQTPLNAALGDQYSAAYKRGAVRGLEATLQWLLTDTTALA